MDVFRLEAEDGNARVGRLQTGHGSVETPFFMPVATKGTVKTLTFEQVRELGADAVISNALLLSLRPGLDTIGKAGGLHRYVDYDGCMFTDSGGFQILNEDLLLKIGDEGVTFRSPVDGQPVLLTAEGVIDIERVLGSDVAMLLDHCPPFGSTPGELADAARRTELWAKRSADHIDATSGAGSNPDQLHFAIVQGGTDADLRRDHVPRMVEMDFPGYAIGGLCIGEPKDVMHKMVELTNTMLPKEKPRYLMGVGSPIEIIESVARGVDVFDSVFPTRNARHGTLFTSSGRLNLGRAANRGVESPPDPDCTCYTCTHHSLSYLDHLYREKEYSFMTLASIHNLHFTLRLMEEIRMAIRAGEFDEFRQGWAGWSG